MGKPNIKPFNWITLKWSDTFGVLIEEHFTGAFAFPLNLQSWNVSYVIRNP